MHFYKELLIILPLLILMPAPVSAATDYGDIQLLIKQQKFEEALKLTNDQLSRNATDIKLQFMKGLILTRLDRLDQAEIAPKPLPTQPASSFHTSTTKVISSCSIFLSSSKL